MYNKHAQLTPHYKHGFRADPSVLATHLKVAGIQIVKGLGSPNATANPGDTTILDLLPRKTLPPAFEKKFQSVGWGLHATLWFSVRKFIWWFTATFSVHLVFIVLWMKYISETDLQNAFVPAGVTTALIGIVLGTLQGFER